MRSIAARATLTYLLSCKFNSKLDPLPLPILLHLSKVLTAFLRHPPLINFVTIVFQSPPHLKRVQTLHRLDRVYEMREVADRRQTLAANSCQVVLNEMAQWYSLVTM